jgi:hypothetical protein
MESAFFIERPGSGPFWRCPDNIGEDETIAFDDIADLHTDIP